MNDPIPVILEARKGFVIDDVKKALQANSIEYKVLSPNFLSARIPSESVELLEVVATVHECTRKEFYA